MDRFQIIERPVTEREMQRLVAPEQRRKKELLMSLPDGAGTYKITFPNEKVYVGESTNVRRRISQILKLFFPSSTTRRRAEQKYIQQRIPKWILRAKQENEIEKLCDLQIEGLLISKTMALQQIPRNQTYN